MELSFVFLWAVKGAIIAGAAFAFLCNDRYLHVQINPHCIKNILYIYVFFFKENECILNNDKENQCTCLDS